MKTNFTELVFILDRSGSMHGLEKDTIGGFNSMIEKQRSLPGDCLVTTALFDDKWELLHDRIALDGIEPITKDNYFVGGRTALLDAIGLTIQKISNAHLHTAKEDRPEKVMFIITTDGFENASHEYDLAQIKSLIDSQKELGWEFLFLGATMDAVNIAGSIGIGADRSIRYSADGRGERVKYSAIDEAIRTVRSNQTLRSDWAMSIEDDMKSR